MTAIVHDVSTFTGKVRAMLYKVKAFLRKLVTYECKALSFMSIVLKMDAEVKTSLPIFIALYSLLRTMKANGLAILWELIRFDAKVIGSDTIVMTSDRNETALLGLLLSP